MEDSAATESRKRQEKLAQLLSSGNKEDYQQTVQRLRETRELFHQELAHQIETPLNEILATMPRATLREKQELAKWLNADLRYLGLGIKAPQSENPTFLRGAPTHNERGTFQLCSSGKRPFRVTFSSESLFPLKLTGNPDRNGRLWERIVGGAGHTSETNRNR